MQNFYSYSNANQRLAILRCGDRSASQTNEPGTNTTGSATYTDLVVYFKLCWLKQLN